MKHQYNDIKPTNIWRSKKIKICLTIWAVFRLGGTYYVVNGRNEMNEMLKLVSISRWMIYVIRYKN